MVSAVRAVFYFHINWAYLHQQPLPCCSGYLDKNLSAQPDHLTSLISDQFTDAAAQFPSPSWIKSEHWENFLFFFLWMKDYQCLIFFPVKVRIKLLFQSIKLKTGWGKKWDHWFNDQFKKTDTECFYFTEAPPETTFEDVFLTLKVSFTQKVFFSSNQLSSISSDLNYIKLLHQITVIQQHYLDIGSFFQNGHRLVGKMCLFRNLLGNSPGTVFHLQCEVFG